MKNQARLARTSACLVGLVMVVAAPLVLSDILLTDNHHTHADQHVETGAEPVAQAFSSDVLHSVPLAASGSGSFTVSATIGGVQEDFLLDTGASMVTVSADLMKKMKRMGGVEKVGRVGARMASGKIEALDVYRVDSFEIAAGCDLGPIDVAVLRSGKRSLLGMSVLQMAAPFTISMTPPALGLGTCGTQPTLAVR